MSLLLIALLGLVTGLRTLTPIAVLCWFAYLHSIVLTGWRGFATYLVSAIIFTLMALGEYVGDKLPHTPSRLSVMGLAGRVLFGWAMGFILAQPLVLNVGVASAIGAATAFAGSHIGFRCRIGAVARFKCADWPVAIAEDIIAIVASIALLHAIAVRGALYLGNAGATLAR